MTKSNIWYLLPRTGLAGAEKHVVALAWGLRDKGYDAGIACVFEEGVLAPEARRLGIPLISLDLPDRWGLRTLTGIFRWLRAQRVDILHTYLFGFHFFAGMAARLAGTPVVLSSRREIARWRKPRHLWMENLGNLFVDRVTCCSRAVEQWTVATERIRRDKVLTLYSGVDLERMRMTGDKAGVRRKLGIPEGAMVIGTVANFSADKGYPYLLDACRLVAAEMPAAYFLFVGSGPLLDEMRETAIKMQCRQMIFTGSRTDIPDMMGAMDVFVLASLTEGLPNAVLEAMAMGKAIVATGVGGVGELIASGTQGVLVEPANAGALARAVLGLLRDPAQAAAMAQKARAKVAEHFTVSRMVDAYEALYASLWKDHLKF